MSNSTIERPPELPAPPAGGPGAEPSWPWRPPEPHPAFGDADAGHGAGPPSSPSPVPTSASALPHRRVGRLVVATTVAALLAGGGAGWLAGRAAAPDARVAATATASTAVAVGTSVPDMIAAVQRSVVTIQATLTTTARAGGRTATETSSGTGFVLAASGMIATNAHVVAGGSQITVTLPDGTTATATVVGSDATADLAVLHIDRTDLVPVTIGSSSALRAGESVVAIGNALGLGGTPTASMGIVSALGRAITTASGTSYTDLVQIDASINPGDSGGPVVALDGSVVGISTAGTTSAENIGFAIPIEQATPVLQRLLTTTG